MGTMLATITHPEQSQISTKCSPQQPEWISSHAMVTGQSLVEVERHWLRFLQLGCNTQGEIPDRVIQDPNGAIGSNKFMKNMLIKLKTVPGPNGVVKFQSFINAMQWLEKASNEEKLKASFGLLNNGNVISEALFRSMIEEIIPNKTQEEYGRITQSVFSACGKISSTGSGRVLYEADYIQFILTSIPPATLQDILHFEVISKEIISTANKANPKDDQLPPKTVNTMPVAEKAPPPKVEASYSLVTDAHIDQLSSNIQQRDFRLLGNKLGFFESDINHLENLYPGNRRQVVAAMLTDWRRREGAKAFVITLQKALHSAKLPDLASLLTPNVR